jgi:hypothetical protein
MPDGRAKVNQAAAFILIMAGLVPAIHDFFSLTLRTRMAGTSPGMTG